MSDPGKRNPPEYRNLHITQIARYRLPLAGYISILHRVSGLLMFLLLPFVLFLLEKSLTSEISFAYFKDLTSGVFTKLILLALTWAYLHHFCAGVRHLLMDTHRGLEKGQAKNSALMVFAISLPLTALVALKLFGAF